MQAFEMYTDENQRDVPVLGVVSLWFGAGLVGVTAVASVVSFQSGGVSGATAEYLHTISRYRLQMNGNGLSSLWSKRKCRR